MRAWKRGRRTTARLDLELVVKLLLSDELALEVTLVRGQSLGDEVEEELAVGLARVLGRVRSREGASGRVRRCLIR
jgi:hypothetical protein